MEILTTLAFLAAARREPERMVAAVERLATGGDDPRLEWRRGPDRLELFGLMDDPPLADMSQAELRELGVADAQIGRVQCARDAAALDALPLDAAVRERLRFRVSQKRTLERRAEDLAHLERYLRGDIAELLLHLDDGQRPIVDLAATGPIIVRGVAGSGKTAVVLHRIHALVRHGSRLTPPRILYLTFNRALAGATAELLRALGLPPGAVEVDNVHRWCRKLLGPAAPRTIVQGQRRQELIDAACHATRPAHPASRLWSYPPSFFDEEIHRIQGRVLDGAPEYLAMQRHGAGRPLDARVRPIVWQVYEAYRALCAKDGVADWDELVRRALERAPGRTYDHVFVDEAQDFTPLALRLASTLSGSAQNLMVAFDPAQSIYERGFRWRACGIAAHGSRSFALLRNHRNAAEILDFARPLLDAIRGDEAEDGGHEDLLSPLASARSGGAPQVLAAPPRAEVAFLAERLRDELEGVPPQNVAVLCFRTATRDRVVEALTKAGVLCRKHDATAELRLTDPSVKVMTMHAAKGLEFPVVYLLVTARDLRVGFADPDDRRAFVARVRKVLYMAMTRAVTRLTLVHDGASPLDDLLRR